MTKTTVPAQSPRADRAVQPVSAPDAAPHTPGDIPGLGPIRVRALHKAGLETLEALRAASLETLLAVPGMSEIKARHIQTYLARFPALPEAATKKKEPRTAVKPDAANAPLLVQWENPASGAPAIPPLVAEAARAMGGVITLLISEHTVNFRNRLLNGLARFTRQCERVVTDGVPIPLQDLEKALRRLRRLTETFVEIAQQSEFDRKAQAKLADDVTEIADWLGAYAGKAEHPKGVADVR
jgi:hypothetical protein